MRQLTELTRALESVAAAITATEKASQLCKKNKRAANKMGEAQKQLGQIPAASQGKFCLEKNWDRIHSAEAESMTPQSWEFA